MASEGMLPPLVLELRAKAGELITEVRAAASETEKAAATTKRAATEVEAASAKAGEGAAAGAAASSAGWQKFMGVSKAAAIGVVGAGLVVGVESLKMAGNFDAAMTRLHTAAGESEGNLKMVGDGLLSIARATGTSTDELTKGMYQIESAGFHGKAGLEVMKAAAQGAKNEGADLEGVGNALTTVMDDLGAKSGQAANLMSQMVAAVGQGKMKMDDLAGSIHSVLPNAAALGIKFPEVAGALATMTAEGVSAEQAAQNLNHTIVKLAAPTTAMSNAMAAYGVNSEQLKNNLGKNGLTGTMDILSKAILDHMGPSGLALMDTFNKSKVAAADVQKMLNNLPPSIQKMAKGFLDGTVGMKDFQKAGKEMGAAGSSQVASFIKLAQTANGFSDALKSGKGDAQTFNQAMYSMLGDQTGLQVALHLTGDHMQTFKDNVKVIGKASADANGNVKDWSVTQDTFNNRMARLKETVQTAAIAIGQKLMPPVSAFVGFLASHQGVVIGFAAVIGGLLTVVATAYFAKVVKGAAENVIAFAKMIKAGVAWAIENGRAFAGAVVDYAKYTAAGETWLAGQLSRFRASAVAAGEWIADHVAGFATMVAGWATTAAAATAAFVAENAATLGIGAAIAVLVAAVIWLVTHWSQAWKWIKEAAEKVWNFLKPAFEWIGNAFHAVAEFVQKHARVIVGALALICPPIALIIAAIHLLVTHWSQIWGAIKSATAAVVGWLEGVWHWIADTFVGGIHAAVSWLSDAWHTAWSAIGDAAKWVYSSILKPVGDWIQGNVLHPINNAVTFLEVAWGIAWRGVGNAMQWVHANVIAPVGSAIHTALSAVGSAVSWLGGVWSSIWDGIKSAVDAVWRFLKPIFDAIGHAVSTVVGGISKIGGAIGSGISGLGKLLGFANGGVIPGSPGEPRLIVAHGGEVMLSRDMLAGRQAPPPELTGTAIDAHNYTPANPTRAALSGESTSTSSPAASSSSGGGPTVIVNVSTPASPAQIAGAVGHELRKTA